jgi:hypothetical protein
MDTPLCQLDPRVVRCLAGAGPCRDGAATLQPPTAECDAVMRSFCSDPYYGRQSYCACLNSRLPCAGFTDPACAGAPLAYRSTSQSPGGADYLFCAARPVCMQTVDVGSQAAVDRVAQVCTADPLSAAKAAEAAAALAKNAAAPASTPASTPAPMLLLLLLLVVAAVVAITVSAAKNAARTVAEAAAVAEAAFKLAPAFRRRA